MHLKRLIKVGAASVLLGGVLITSACTFQPDPTEAIFYVRVLNDTSRTVALSICGTGDALCRKPVDTERLAPGNAWPSVETAVDLINPVLIRDLRGRRLGCLPLFFDYNAEGTVVRVSELVPCQAHYPARTAKST